jgi:hypothetical protein
MEMVERFELETGLEPSLSSVASGLQLHSPPSRRPSHLSSSQGSLESVQLRSSSSLALSPAAAAPPPSPPSPEALPAVAAAGGDKRAGGGQLTPFVSAYLARVEQWQARGEGWAKAFFLGIVLLSVGVLANESFLGDTSMVVGDELGIYELGAVSVTYTLFYHFLFIVAGYGLRAFREASVLFLDVYRSGINSVLLTLLGGLVALLSHLPPISEGGGGGGGGGGGVWRPLHSVFLLLLPLFLAGVCLGNLRPSNTFSRLTLKIGFSRFGSHL